jgi:medium-chain acyl-[acyl-carrier-protein] hydrolase
MPDPAWFHVPVPRPDAPLRLICFPHAGGGAAAFRGWPDLMGRYIEVAAARLPGRENRFAEPRLRRMPDAVRALTAALLPSLDRPYALFGHSLGALLAYETARALAAAGRPEPVHLVVAASRAPGHQQDGPPLHSLPDDAAFVARLREFGGLPDEVLAQTALISVLLPTVRDDFELAESYRPPPGPPLHCPVTALAGSADRTAGSADLERWRTATTGPFRVRTAPGGHFFVSDAAATTAALVKDALGAVERAGPATSGRWWRDE